MRLLPYIDEQVTYKHIDLEAGAYAPKNDRVRKMGIPLFICPSSAQEPGPGSRESNYAGCHHDVEAPIDADNHGVFFLNSRVKTKDVTDGPAHTIYVGEKRVPTDDLGWMSGTRATLRNTGTPLNMTPGEVDDAFRAKAVEPAEGEADDPAAAKRAEAAALYVGGFGSAHPAVTNMLFGDGKVLSVNNEIALSVLQQLGHRSDGKLLTEGPTRVTD